MTDHETVLVKDNPHGTPRQYHVLQMRKRTVIAIENTGRGADDLDRQWLVRQRLLQGIRERGWDLILRPGDIGYYDADYEEDFMAGIRDGAHA